MGVPGKDYLHGFEKSPAREEGRRGMSFSGWLLVPLVIPVLVARGFAQDVELPNNLLAGEELFSSKGCVTCHSIMGRGGKTGSDLGKTLSRTSPIGIVSLMWNHASDMTRVMEHSFEMPNFSGEEMRDLVAFLYFLNYFDQPGDAGNGEKIISIKGCTRCHSIKGSGGKIGPPLDTMKKFASPVYLAQAMWNHGSGMSATMKRFTVERPTLRGKDIVDILAFIRSINQESAEKQTYMAPGNPKAGEELFQVKKCFRCHKIGGDGKSIVPDLTKKEFNVGAAEIAARMWNHGSVMFAKMKDNRLEVPTFQGSEMADVIAYLYFLGFVSQAGDVEQGKRIFSEKRCSECHAHQGVGGNVGPDLSTSKNVSNFIDAAATMWNHGYTMRMLMQKMKIPIPRFTPREMNDLLAYIRSGQER
jgi:cytochrome c2